MSNIRIHWPRCAGAMLAIGAFANPSAAATINVDGSCSIAQAIEAAETDAVVAGCLAGSGADEILIPDGTDEVWGSAPPALNSVLTLRAVSGRATIRRGTTAPYFTLLTVDNGDLTLEDLTLRDGVTDDLGGCVIARGAAVFTARRSVFDGCGISPTNTASLPAGSIYSNGTLLLDSCLVVNTQATPQGAIRVVGGVTTLLNTTVTASGGAGVRVWNGTLELTHATLAGNADFDLRVRGGRIVNARNSVIQNPEGALSIDSSNLWGVDPLLAPLADNGGPTSTLTPLQGSPLLDAADSSFCTATDQRGSTRPSGDACDIGAVEHTVVCGNGFLHPSEDCDGTQFQPAFTMCPPGYVGTPVCDATCSITGVPNGCTPSPPDAGPDASSGGQAGGGAGGMAGAVSGGSGGGAGTAGAGGTTAPIDAGAAGSPTYTGDGSTADGGTRQKKVDDGDCGCRLHSSPRGYSAWFSAGIALFWLGRRRRRGMR